MFDSERIERRRSGLSPAKQARLEKWRQGSFAASASASLIPRRLEQDAVPLSFAQERLWFLEQLEPGTTMYLIPLAMRLEGELHVKVLRESLNEVVQRHEVLRTHFRLLEGNVRQVIRAWEQVNALPMVLYDLSGLAVQTRARSLEQVLQQEASTPFDLEQAPLLRVRLLRLAPQEHQLVVLFHHIITDGWSLGIFWHELATLYKVFLQGKPSPLSPLPIQYADYALWQRAWLQGAVLEQQLVYWKKHLREVPSLDLPTDHPRPAMQRFQGASHSFTLSQELIQHLKALSQREGVTLFMTLLAAFQVLLARYSGQHDIVVGTPIANRRHTQIEPLIGFFANTLVLRTDLSGNPSVHDLLHRVREVCLQAYAHQDLPFEKIVEALHPERDLSRTPLVQVLFILQNMVYEPVDVALSDLVIHPLAPVSQAAKFDLTLSLRESEQGMYGSLEYHSDLFEETSIQRMLTHWQLLLQGMVAHPEQRIGHLPLVSHTERECLLTHWNATQMPFEQHHSIHHLFAAQVERTPDAIALVDKEEQLTYRELHRRATHLAGYLHSLGVRPEMVVGLALEPSLLMVIGILGILQAGGAYLPLDLSSPPERVTFLLQDSQAQGIVTYRQAAEPFLHQGRFVVSLDADWELIEHTSLDGSSQEVLAQNMAYIIYTSGSTGHPKGVMGTHYATLNRFSWMWATYPFAANEVGCQKTTISFVDSIWELFGSLLAGIRTVIIAQEAVQEVPRLLDLLAGYAITRLVVVPSLLRTMLQVGEALPEKLAQMKYVMSSGEELPLDLVEHFQAAMPQCPLLNLYGSSEMAADATAYDSRRGRTGTRVPIGTPIANTQVYILDTQLELVPLGVAGELYVGGAGVARGYVHQAALTAERFVPDPFGDQPGGRLYRTGDLVRWREDGVLEYVGRRDGQVKLRGYRIELGEIEAVLRQHPAVREAVVQVQEVRPQDRRLIAYLVLKEGPETVGSPAVWRQGVQQRLPSYMVPAAWVVLHSLPLTPTGKVDRRALPMPEEMQETTLGAWQQASTPIEELLVGSWREILGRTQVGRHDNFFELGGHSLLATQLISHIRALLAVEIPLRTIFEAPTVAALAQRIERVFGTPEEIPLPPLVAGERPAEIPLSFAQQRLWLLNQLEPESPAYLLPHAFLINGAVEVNALEQSLQALIRRHESLRTTFEAHAGLPMQVIHPAFHTTLPMIDLQGLEPEQREQVVRTLASQEAQCPCDLAQGPLLRTTLLRLGSDDHVLLLTLHHIITDGWSNGVLVRELTTLYHSFASGHPSPLAPLPVQYADYALWQRAWLQGAVLEQQLAYWKKHLREAPTLDLPTDRPRPAMQRFHGASHSFTLSQELTQQLNALSQHEGVTLFMTLLAAFQVLLARYSGQQDIVVGTPIANRRHTQIESLIGFFANTLVIRTDLADNPSMHDLLHRVRQVCLHAYAHQDLPFEKIVEEVQSERDLSRSPLFQVMFILQHASSEAFLPDLSALSIRPVALESHTAKFDLTLSLRESKQGIDGSLEYRSDLFEKTSIQRLLTHWQILLQGMIAHPEQRIGHLPLLSDAERQCLLTHWNATQMPFEQEQSIHQLFAAQVERTPDAIALVDREEQLTYRELERRATHVAGYLHKLGVGPEMVVGVALEPSLLMVIGILGILKVGGAYLPLDLSSPPERLRFMLQDSQAQGIVTHHEAAESFLHHSRFVVSLDADWELITQVSNDASFQDIAAQNMAYIVYTSGSTGHPKGVIGTHQATLNRFSWMWATYPFATNEVGCQKTTISFVDSIWELFGSLLQGVRTVIIAQKAVQEVPRLLDLLAVYAVTRLVVVPSLLRTMLQVGEALPEKLAQMNYVMSSGEALPLDLVEHFQAVMPQCPLLNLYGSSEVAADATAYDSRTAKAGRRVPIGTPIANTQVYILDAHLELVPIGVSGELYVGGVGVARGYVHQAILTAERFMPDPFGDQPGGRLYRTGDLVRWREDGVLEYVGRRDGQVKLRGYRIELGEIEAVLRQHPAVREAVVQVQEVRPQDRRLIAYLVLKEGPETVATPETWRQVVQQRLPAYMVPAAWVVLHSLPLTSTGKLDRRRLPLPERVHYPTKETYTAPFTHVERRIAGIWQELLHVEKIGVHDNFFELGGHSLLLVQLQYQLQIHFQVELSLLNLFSYPTVNAQARYFAPPAGDVASSQPPQAQRERDNDALIRQRQIRQKQRNAEEGKQRCKETQL